MKVKAQIKLKPAIKIIVNANPAPSRILAHPSWKIFKANKEPTAMIAVNKITQAIIRQTIFKSFAIGWSGLVVVT